MREFTDKPSCDKCGSEYVSIAYTVPSPYVSDQTCYLFCTCSRCGFYWSMKTKDAENE